MLFSYNWLNEYLEGAPSPGELSERLVMSGTEIESITRTGAAFTGVVTAEILSCDKHPNADKLSLCRVRTDKDELSIVCGARNMKPGDKVALALVGADLPGGFRIKRSKIRGVESQGMMCSEVELGLKDSSEGIMILPPETPLGADFSAIIGSDFMMEAGVTPNRADLLSIRGLAREAAAVTGALFRDKDFVVAESGPMVGECASVAIAPEAPCARYAARVVEGVKVGPSPEALRARLEAHGIRSVNNVVDATNLVLLELGQPLHAFDLDTLAGRSIVVRLAADGESIVTIDGKERALDSSTLVIADASRPVAVAGVMGGKATEVSEATTSVLIEGACFEPSSVRRASRKLGLSSESSYRFERGVDMESIAKALDMAAGLVLELAGGAAAKGMIDACPGKAAPRAIDFRVSRAQDLLGAEISEKELLDIFGRLGMAAVLSSPGAVSVVPPSYRMDLAHETDLVEEAARIYGYDKILTTLPVARLMPGDPGALKVARRRVKALLVGSGLTEVMNYSFVSMEAFASTGSPGKDGVAILNPITEEQVVMRDSLLPSLLDNLAFNIGRKAESVRVFEVAPVFVRGEALPDERWMVSGLLYGRRYDPVWSNPSDEADFFDVKGLVERLLDGLGIEVASFERVELRLLHPGKAALLKVAGRPAGVLGELHPELLARYNLKMPAYLFELELEVLKESSRGAKAYEQLAKYPESSRDIAFIVDEDAPFADISDAIGGIDRKLIEKVELFDVYYAGNIPPGKRSLAVRVTYRSRDRTLTGQEVEDIHSRAVKELTYRFKAEIRV